jgi:exopolysaccharide biosynthesis polyprenyl glycosylphosphotransferase
MWGLLRAEIEPTPLDTPRARGIGAQGVGVLGLERDVLRRRLLALADVATAATTTMVTALLVGTQAASWMALCLPVWIVLAKLHGLYDRDHRSLRHLTVDEIPEISLWVATSILVIDALLTFAPPARLPIGEVLKVMIVAFAAAFFYRAAARALWRRMAPRERALIVGTGRFAAAARRKLNLFPDMHVEVVNPAGELVDGTAGSSLDEAVAHVDRVILAHEVFDEELVESLLETCRLHRVKLSVVPPVRGMFGTATQLTHVAELPIVEYNTWDVSQSTLVLKRAMDIAMAVPLLVLFLPLFAAVAVAIKLDSRGPVIFSQRRAGKDGRPFAMLKFRTMVADAEARLAEFVSISTLAEPAFKLQNDPRVTRVGRLLRRTSLDELPQLLNILLGRMSLVGPRPEQIELVERYAPEHRFRLSVKPGLTGPMQVNGRGALTFEERLAVERDYIENVSLRRDVKILVLTVSSVVSGRGAY